ncbi:molybdopterin-binding domain-containing protein [Pseudomonas monteilii]|uniref:hypothetical protein n=1 Tax=Pseudomonas monteilii TaxID=76759 RepID=UPI0036F18230
MIAVHAESVLSTYIQPNLPASKIASIQALIEKAATVEEASILGQRVATQIDRIGYQIGFDTLLDIIKNSNNSELIKEIFTVKLNEYTDRQSARISSMLKPLRTVKVNYSTLPLSESLALVGKMGEGKNALCMEPWFEQARKADKLPIFVAPLRSLLAKFSGAEEHYESIEDPYQPRTGLRTTAHSFVNKANEKARRTSCVLMVDELVKTTEIINSKIWGSGSISARLDGWKEIIDVARRAEIVVLSDAHLGQAYLDIFQRLTGKAFPAYEPPVSSYATINVAYGFTQDTLLKKTMDIVSVGGKVAYFFDGRIDDGRAIEALLKEQGVRAIFLHSADKTDAGSKILEVCNDTRALDNYDVVICSPAIGPGWSCVLPAFTEVMIECLGTISPASVLQCVKRFRAAKNVSIAFSLNTSRGSAKRNLPETASNVAFYEASEEFIDEAVDHDAAYRLSREYLSDPIGYAICEMKALENWSRNRYESFVVRGLETLGFNVRFEVVNQSCEMKALKKKHAAQIVEEKKSYFANDQFLRDEALVSARGRKPGNGASQRSQWLIEKSFAAAAMGLSRKFNSDEIDFLIDRSGIEIFNRCNLVSGNGKVNHSNTVIAELFKDLLNFANATKVVYTRDLEKFVEKLKSEKLCWNSTRITKYTLITRTLFEVKGANKLLSAVKGILALLGFRLYSSPCRTAGKYLIDSSLYEFAMSYIVSPGVNSKTTESDSV